MNQLDRVLSIYDALIRGVVVKRDQEALKYGVDSRTISRDIRAICDFIGESNPGFQIPYNREMGGYYLPRQQLFWLTQEEVLALTKIILESRSLNKTEIKVLDKLHNLCDPQQRKIVQAAVQSELHHYHPVKHGEDMFTLIWQLNSAIREKRLVEINYQRAAQSGTVTRTIEPLAILFSEYYFYLIANIHQGNYPDPAVYRLDRIQKFTITADHFKVNYGSFNEGEFRKRVQFMQKGSLIRLELRVQESALEATLDRLPTAAVTAQEGNVYTVTAEVYGSGIMMWLLSQGDLVHVLAPADFRNKIKEKIESMLNLY